MTAVLFWDIDGTLLTTHRAGIPAWEEACERVLGRRVDLAAYPTAGLTDVEIALALAGPDQARAQDLVRAYEEALPRALHGKPVTPFAEARAALEATKDRSDVVSLLLTGNTRRGALAKLAAAGLGHLLELDGGFSLPLRSRGAVAGAAWEAARRRVGVDLDPRACLVIGDTRHDVDAARAIGVRALGVATGGATIGELTEAGAWRVLARLPPPEALLLLAQGPAAELVT